MLPHTDPVHKVSIIARGMAGGYTMALPQEDRTLVSRNKFLDDLAFTLGGRAAEELVFDDITSGASNDLERVTQMARTMVTRLGMSEDLGPLVYGKRDELIFLGREISEQRDYSEAIAEQIDEEVRTLINTAYQRAITVLTEYRDKLDEVALRLLEVETISRSDLKSYSLRRSRKRALLLPCSNSLKAPALLKLQSRRGPSQLFDRTQAF